MASGLRCFESTSTNVSLVLFLTTPTDSTITHPRRIVLELVDAWYAGLELLGHQYILVAINGNADLLAHLVDAGAVIPIERRRRVPLGVAGRTQPRFFQDGRGLPVLRATGRTVDLDRHPVGCGARLDQLERRVPAGVGEQPPALADDHRIGEQDELVDEVVVE